MANQENCVTIVNNVIEKIKEISKKVSSDETYENDNINVLGDAVDNIITGIKTISSNVGGDGNKENKDINKLAGLVNDLIVNKDEMTNNNVTLSSENARLNDELEKTQKALEECNTSLKNMSDENAQAQAAAENKRKEMEAEVAAAVDSVKKAKADKIEADKRMKEMKENADNAVSKANKDAAAADEAAKKAQRLADEAEGKAAAATNSADEAKSLKDAAQQAQKDAEEARKQAEEAQIAANSEKAKAEGELAAFKQAKKDSDDKFTSEVEFLTSTITDLQNQLNVSNNLNALKDDQIGIQNIELSSKDDEIEKLLKKNRELKIQIYATHLTYESKLRDISLINQNRYNTYSEFLEKTKTIDSNINALYIELEEENKEGETIDNYEEKIGDQDSKYELELDFRSNIDNINRETITKDIDEIKQLNTQIEKLNKQIKEIEKEAVTEKDFVIKSAAEKEEPVAEPVKEQEAVKEDNKYVEIHDPEKGKKYFYLADEKNGIYKEGILNIKMVQEDMNTIRDVYFITEEGGEEKEMGFKTPNRKLYLTENEKKKREAEEEKKREAIEKTQKSKPKISKEYMKVKINQEAYDKKYKSDNLKLDKEYNLLLTDDPNYEKLLIEIDLDDDNSKRWQYKFPRNREEFNKEFKVVGNIRKETEGGGPNNTKLTELKEELKNKKSELQKLIKKQYELPEASEQTDKFKLTSTKFNELNVEKKIDDIISSDKILYDNIVEKQKLIKELLNKINNLNEQIKDSSSSNSNLLKELKLIKANSAKAKAEHTETIKAINSMLELNLGYENLNDNENIDEGKLEGEIQEFNKTVEEINDNAKTKIQEYEKVGKPVIEKLRIKLSELNDAKKRMMRLAILSKEQQQDLENIDNLKKNIPTLLNNLTKYNPNDYMTIPPIGGEDYNGIMAQIYNSLLANNEKLYTGEVQDMTILSDVKEEDGVLIKLYKEKLNLENILDMIKKKFEDYKDNNNKQEYENLGYLEKFKKFKEEKTNYSYKGYNLQAATIASTKPIITDNEKIIPVNDFFEDVVSSFETNNNEMEEMKNKVEDFLKTKTSESETISKLQNSVGKLKSDIVLDENKINSHFDKFKNLKENLMKFKKYIDSNNLKISSLLKEKIDAIHNNQDAKEIFSEDKHKLLPEYTESSKEINNQIEEDTKIIISRFLTRSVGEEYNKGESGGSSDNKTTSRNIDLVLEEFSTTSSTSGGYSKNKVKMDTNSIKKRKRSIKKYK